MANAPTGQPREMQTREQALQADKQWRGALLFRNTRAGSQLGTGLAGALQHPARRLGETAHRHGISGTEGLQFRSSRVSQFPDNYARGAERVLVRNHNEVARPRGIIEAFVNTCQRWKLEEDQKLVLLGLNGTDSFGKLLLRGLARLQSRDQESRIRYVLLISLGLEILFNNDIDAEIAWLTHPRTDLGDASPLDHMLKGDIIQLMTVSEIVKRERGL